MGSRDGDLSAGAKKSHSDKDKLSPFVDKWEGYTWDQEARQWSYDGHDESHPPSRYELKSPASPPFEGRDPFTDDSGTRYVTPGERGHSKPPNEYGRYRSNSPESLSAYWSSRTRMNEVQGTRKSRSLSPNPASFEPGMKPEDIHWKPAEDERLVSSIKEGRLTWAQISTQVGSRDETSCKLRWNRIKSEHPDVQHVNSRHVATFSEMDASST